MTRTAYYI